MSLSSKKIAGVLLALGLSSQSYAGIFTADIGMGWGYSNLTVDLTNQATSAPALGLGDYGTASSEKEISVHGFNFNPWLGLNYDWQNYFLTVQYMFTLPIGSQSTTDSRADFGPTPISYGSNTYINLQTHSAHQINLLAGFYFTDFTRFYALTGLEAMHFESSSINGGLQGPTGEVDQWIKGVQFGLGLSALYKKNWEARLEWVYTSYFDKINTQSAAQYYGFGAPVPVTVSTNYSFQKSEYRLVLDYRFDFKPQKIESTIQAPPEDIYHDL